MNNEKLKIKSYGNRNNGKDNSLQIFNSSPYMQGVECDEYKKKVCQTYQNIDKNYDDENGNNCLKELKMKEMTFFIKKCKLYLDQITFEKILKIFQEYKNGIITDEGIIKKVNHYLKNNTELLNLFKNIIS
jgi:histone deacetylase complex regulatory component SIN3